jgi:hypothetical protein
LDNTGSPEAILTVWNLESGLFQRSTINGDITSPVLDTSNGFISVTPHTGHGGAEQPDSTINIAAGVPDFYSSVILRNGVMWGLNTIDNDGRAALRWFAIDANTNAVLQEGVIAGPNQDVYMGSIAVNEFNDVVIGFNISSASQFVSSYAVLGTAIDGVMTFGEPLLLQTGVARYELTGGSSSARWGDYSATMVDPSNPTTFWTFQGWVSGENVWSIQITQLQLAMSCLGTGTARLRGQVRRGADPTGIQGVTIGLIGSSGCQDTTSTNARGHFVFRTLSSGTYTVTPEKDSCTFIPPSRMVTIDEADPQARSLDDEADPQVRFRGRCR